jgi:hypothetical protein
MISPHLPPLGEVGAWPRRPSRRSRRRALQDRGDPKRLLTLRKSSDRDRGVGNHHRSQGSPRANQPECSSPLERNFEGE